MARIEVVRSLRGRADSPECPRRVNLSLAQRALAWRLTPDLAGVAGEGGVGLAFADLVAGGWSEVLGAGWASGPGATYADAAQAG
jgi:hypothetical protein